MKYLRKLDLIQINRCAIEADSHPDAVSIVLDMNGLDAIIQQPQQFVFGQELYPTVWLKAAFIFQKLIKKHIFADANKRTAVIATLFFLNQNRYKCELSSKSWLELTQFVVNSIDSEELMLYVAKLLKDNSFKC